MLCNISSLSIRLVSEAALASSRCGCAYPPAWASCHSHLISYTEQGLRNSTAGSTHLWNEKWWGRKKKDLPRVNQEQVHGGIHLLLQTWKKSTQTPWSTGAALTRCVCWRQGDHFVCCHICEFLIISIINMIRDLLWWGTEMFVTQNQFNHWFSISMVSVLLP